MELDRMRQVAAIYGEMTGDERATTDTQVSKIQAAMGREFPALCESDQAAVAWYIAGLVKTISELSVLHIGDVLNSSSAAYGILAVKLLGWC